MAGPFLARTATLCNEINLVRAHDYGWSILPLTSSTEE